MSQREFDPLLIKLACLVAHYEEFTSPGGHPFDKRAIDSLRSDPEVEKAMSLLDRFAFLPVKRNAD